MTLPLNFAAVQFSYSLDHERLFKMNGEECSPLQTLENLKEKYGGDIFDLGLSRCFYAFEIHLKQSDLPTGEKEEFFSFFDELVSGEYRKEDVQKLLKLFFFLVLPHPQTEHFVRYFKERELKKHIHHLALKENIRVLIPEDQIEKKKFYLKPRKIGFVEVNGIKTAKYIQKNSLSTKVSRSDNKVYQGLDAECWAYKISKLFGNRIVPLITRFPEDTRRKILKREGLLQEFFDPLISLIDYYERGPEAMQALFNLPSIPVQLYLLHEMIIGQGDAHAANVAFTKTYEIFNIDNEMSFPPRNYEVGQLDEGLGGGRIILMAFPQAKVPLPQAILRLFTLPILKERVLRVFLPNEREKNEDIYSATKERIELIAKHCRYALENPSFELSCEILFHALFTHEDFVIKNRWRHVPDLYIYYHIGNRPPNIPIDDYVPDCPTVEVPEGYPPLSSEEFSGLSYLTKVRNLYCYGIKSQGLKTIMTIRKEEVDEKLFSTYDPIRTDLALLPLFLRGTPKFTVKRILREFPWFNLRVSPRKNKYVLQITPYERIKEIFNRKMENITPSTEKVTIDLNSADFKRYQRLRRRRFENLIPRHIVQFSKRHVGFPLMWKLNILRYTHSIKEEQISSGRRLIFVKKEGSDTPPLPRSHDQ